MPRQRAFKKAPPGAVCSVTGCGRPFMAKGYCPKHYRTWLKYGDPTIRRRVEKGRGCSRFGYVRASQGGKTRLVHRVVMEQILGRPLLPHENVHHINGVRNDNRPENLELWSKSQPCGQRVEDKVAWAREIIRLYGHMFENHGKP